MKTSWVLAATAAIVGAASAQPEPSFLEPHESAQSPLGKEEMEEMSLAELMEVKIPTAVTATKDEESVDRAPAVVSVITAAQIQARGYRSLAQLLRAIPGFYDVYD